MPADLTNPPNDATTSTALPENKCQVIPAHDEPPCPQPGTRRGERGPEGQAEKLFLCNDHHVEHQKLYFTYKAASYKVIELRKKIGRECSASEEESWGKERLDEVIATHDEYAAAIAEELEKRESHRKRFYAQADSGHASWSKSLRRDQATNANVLARLRRRRDGLAEAARAQAEEERKAQVAAQVAQRLKEEAARRRELESAQKRSEEAERTRQVIAAAAARRQREEQEATERQNALRRALEFGEQYRRREAEEAAARRAHATTRETQPLLNNVAQSSPPSNIYPQVTRAAGIQPYGSRALPQGVDIERQVTVPRLVGEVEGEPEFGWFDICFVLVLGVFVFFTFVKFIG